MTTSFVMNPQFNFLHNPVTKISMLIALLLCFEISAIAQPQNQQDEKPENLQVLPETMSIQQVRRVMFRFNDALGVNCLYCHVGEEGQPDTFNFASDEKEVKETTRAMMRMVSAINDDHITQLSNGDERNTVNCQTCHHGLAVPQRLENVLADYLPDNGTEETLKYYEELREEYYGGSSYDFQEGTLNTLAQRLISMQEPETAMAFLERNISMYPESADAYVLMGEAYVQLENQDAAIKNYEKAVSLNPDNRRASRRLAQLKGEQ